MEISDICVTSLIASAQEKCTEEKQDSLCTYKRNTQTLLPNNFCRGKAVSIKYCECVSVALIILNANHMPIVMSSVARQALPYFSALPLN
jgi:hypothetical protein